jgi:hypothetical protein
VRRTKPNIESRASIFISKYAKKFYESFIYRFIIKLINIFIRKCLFRDTYLCILVGENGR